MVSLPRGRAITPSPVTRQCVSRNQNHHEEYLPEVMATQFQLNSRMQIEKFRQGGSNRLFAIPGGMSMRNLPLYWWHPVETDRPVR